MNNDTPSIKAQPSRHGFTLTEIAVVLGIIGLILGAIWTAASSVYENYRVEKATTEVLTIVHNVRSLYANTSTMDALADMTLTAGSQPAGTAQTYLQVGIFPSDTLDTGNPSTATQAINPWGGNIIVASDNPDNQLEVFFTNVPIASCIRFVSAITSSNGTDGLKNVSVIYNSRVGQGVTIPTTLSPVDVAVSNCTSHPASAPLFLTPWFEYSLK